MLCFYVIVIHGRWQHAAAAVALRKASGCAFISILSERTGANSRTRYWTTVLIVCVPVAPVAYQVILEPGIGQFREFEPRRVHTRINSLGLFLVHKLTCGKRASVS